MKRQLLLTIAALAVFGCTSGTPVPFNENESEDEADIETHLRDVDLPVEKRAVYSCKFHQDFVLCVHMLLLSTQLNVVD